MESKKKTSEDWNPGDDTDTRDDPLLDSLMVLARLHGRTVSRTGLTNGLPLVKNRLTVELFPRAASRAALSSRVLHRPLKKISSLELPVVLLLKNRQVCVLVEMDPVGGECKVLMPETGMGEKKLSLEELEALYSGYAIYVRPEFRVEGKNLDGVESRSKRGGWFWGTLFGSWRIYRDVLVASFMINVLALATPFFILNVYDRVIPNNAIETLWVLAIGIGFVYLVILLMRGLRGYFIDEAGKKANLQMSSTLFAKVLGLRMEVRPKSTGSFTSNLQQFESVRDFITSFSITALMDLPFAGLALLVIWYLGANIVIIHVVAILLLLLYAVVVQVPLKHAVERSYQASAQKNAILVDGLSGLETIKILGAESHIQRAWEEAVSYISTWSVKARFLSSSVQHVSNFIQNVTVVAVVIGGVYMISNGNLSQGGLIALVILTRQAINPMSQVVNLMTRFHQAKTALKTLNTIMELPEERPEEKSFLHRIRFRGEIDLKNISFTYPDQSTEILKNISFKINAGERVGIIGPIGSGKTTLGKLILGLYQPTGGMICIDGTDIRQIDPAELRHCIGAVSQDGTLFRGSVRENITLGAYDVDDATVLRAADMGGVSDFARRNSMGFDMEVGEQGRGLSGGQRQCVAIARAVLHDPPVLVLDEPTSSMDNRTEQKIKNNFKKILQGKTLMVITHRASMLELVDRVVVLDNGVIVADGSRQTVMEALRNGQLNV